MNAIDFTPREIGNGFSLRAATLADAGEMYAVIDRNRDHLAHWLAWVPGARAAGDIELFLLGALDSVRRGSGVTCAILSERRIVGAVGLHRTDSPERCAEIGYWLGQEACGRGVMTDAVRAMIAYAFAELGIHRVELIAATENIRSRNIAQRLGMTHEATLRERLFIRGGYVDAELYAVLAPPPASHGCAP